MSSKFLKGLEAKLKISSGSSKGHQDIQIISEGDLGNVFSKISFFNNYKD